MLRICEGNECCIHQSPKTPLKENQQKYMIQENLMNRDLEDSEGITNAINYGADSPPPPILSLVTRQKYNLMEPATRDDWRRLQPPKMKQRSPSPNSKETKFSLKLRGVITTIALVIGKCNC